MKMKIIEIEIQYFRSIEKLIITPDKMNILIGDNNSGKSNILKALNLFFNGETGYEEKFIFQHDHNYKDCRKKQNVSIRIKFELFGYKYVKYVEEKKTWLSSNNLSDYNRSTYIKYMDKNGNQQELLGRTNKFYNSKRYFYVPAMRSKEYFADILGQLYLSMYYYNAQDILDSAHEFEGKLTDLIKAFFTTLQEKSPVEQNDNQIETATLPDDLTHIFENLDIRTQGGISLNRRGDGVRSWQIPIMLKYIYDSINKKSGSSTPIFWGIEEPENNIELSATFKLANLLQEYSNSCQTFITTHSPAIYSLQGNSNVLTYHVNRVMGSHSQYQKVNEIDAIHDEGLLNLIAPYVAEKEKELFESKEALKTAENNLRSYYNQNILMVEGESDKIIFEKILQILDKNIPVISCDSAPNSIHKAKAWMHHQTAQRSSSNIAIVILDDDEPGNKAKEKINTYKDKEINNNNQNCLHAICIPKKQIVIDMLKKFQIPIDLEKFYPLSAYQKAIKENWIAKISNEKIDSRIKIKDFYKSSYDIIKDYYDIIKDDKNGAPGLEKYFLCYEVPMDKKTKLAEYVSNLDNFATEMKCLIYICERKNLT